MATPRHQNSAAALSPRTFLFPLLFSSVILVSSGILLSSDYLCSLPPPTEKSILSRFKLPESGGHPKNPISSGHSTAVSLRLWLIAQARRVHIFKRLTSKTDFSQITQSTEYQQSATSTRCSPRRYHYIISTIPTSWKARWCVWRWNLMTSLTQTCYTSPWSSW